MKHFDYSLSDNVRMSIKEKQLSRRLNILKAKLEVIMRQRHCDLPKAVEIFKRTHEVAKVKLSEETLLDLELLEKEAYESANGIA